MCKGIIPTKIIQHSKDPTMGLNYRLQKVSLSTYQTQQKEGNRTIKSSPSNGTIKQDLQNTSNAAIIRVTKPSAPTKSTKS